MTRLVIAIDAVHDRARVLAQAAAEAGALAGQVPSPAAHVLDPDLRAACASTEAALRAAVESIRDDLRRLGDAVTLAGQLYRDVEMTGIARWAGSPRAGVGPIGSGRA